MVIKVKSFFNIKIGGLTRVKVHNTLSPGYINLLQGLLTKGQLAVSFNAPSNIYIVLLNQGTVVAKLPANLGNFNEQVNPINTNICQNNLTSCNLKFLVFQLEYNATDETNDTYTFNEVQIWADDYYMIAYAEVSPITKNSNTFVTVTWEATVTITSNNVLYIPGCNNFSFAYNTQVNLQNFQPLLCLNIPYIIIAVTLIPYDLIPQNSFLYSQLSALSAVLGLVNLPSTPPTQLLVFQGVQYYVVGNTAYPITQPFTLSNTQQPNTVTLYLLYGINSNYFIYTTCLSATLQYQQKYTPTLIINITEE